MEDSNTTDIKLMSLARKIATISHHQQVVDMCVLRKRPFPCLKFILTHHEPFDYGQIENLAPCFTIAAFLGDVK